MHQTHVKTSGVGEKVTRKYSKATLTDKATIILQSQGNVGAPASWM